MVAQEAPRRQARSPYREDHADEVQHDEDGAGRQAQPEEVGAAQQQQALGGDAQVADQDRALRETRGGGGHGKPASGVDDVQRQHARRRSQQGGSAKGQVVPLLRQWLPLDGRGLEDPDRAHSCQRQHPDEDHQCVRHHCPAQKCPRDDRDIPARAGAVQEQPDRHHRHRGADVVWRRQQDVHPGRKLRREHDAGCDEHRHHRRTPNRSALGQQRGQQHRERVGHRRGHVHDVLVQPAQQLHQHVLRNFGGVVRDVPERPAAQQQVAVQRVPGLQGLARAVGVDGPRPRQPQVAREGRDHAEHPYRRHRR